MASLAKGRKQGQWKAYYYDRATKTQKWVPVEVTHAWEGYSRQQAEAALDAWLAGKGVQQLRSRRRSALGSDEVRGLIKAFIAECRALSGAKEGTVDDLAHHLEGHALDYFVRVKETKDVRLWFKHTPWFSTWLRTTFPEQKVGTTRKICQTLTRFGAFLAEAQVIPQPWLVKMPKLRVSTATPLPRAIEAKEVLEVAGKLRAAQPRWALFVLLGYFASLRPEEIYALGVADFLTGARAKKEAKTYKRLAEAGMGSGLSVAVSKTFTRYGREPLTKTHYSAAVVNVWDVEAARKIAEILRDSEPGPLFVADKRDDLDREYKTVVKAHLNVVAYDLRRASGLYLGRTKGLDPFLLQDHMRHSSMTTTLLYTRRPVEEQETADNQDFGDVG